MADTSDTYQSSQITPDGRTTKTFYNASGEILGFANSYTNEDGSSGTSFEDAERNWVGDNFSDPERGFSSSFSRTELKDTDGSITGYIEKGTNRQVDPTDSSIVIYSRSFEYNFDADYALISGTETEGLTTTTYGADWLLKVLKLILLIFLQLDLIQAVFQPHC